MATPTSPTQPGPALTPSPTISADYDVVLVGGGLASSLCALALRRRQPRLRLAMVEASQVIGGNHTWSFHAGDVDEEGAALLSPLVHRRWPAVEVVFPDHRRLLELGYSTILSSALDAPVRQALSTAGSCLLLGRKALQVGAREVLLDDGQRLTAQLVLDGRGPVAPPAQGWAEARGYQKFLGQELQVSGETSAFPLDRAMLMDASVQQEERDGAAFRFMYVLPLGPGRLLVEDTAYADTAKLDRQLSRSRISAYLDRRGVRVEKLLREEEGMLDLPFTDETVPPLGAPLRLGARGGWFHPTTGYTLPLATRVALTLARTPLTSAASALVPLYARYQRQARFARRLNRLMFRAMQPAQRWRLLSRFYRMPAESIARFYALDSTALDRARVLGGRPPQGLSLTGALSILQAA